MHRSTKSFSFLLEFILVLLFFSISSAICVHVQSVASQMNRKANDIKIAMNIIQNYMSSSNVSLFYDENGIPSESAYFSILEENNEVSVMVDDEVLICLPYIKEDDYERE